MNHQQPAKTSSALLGDTRLARLSADSVWELQAVLLLEDLVRRFPNEVNSLALHCRVLGEKVWDASKLQKALTDILQPLGCIMGLEMGLVLWGTDWVVQCFLPNTPISDEEEEDLEVTISLEACSANSKWLSDLREKISSSGLFQMTDRFGVSSGVPVTFAFITERGGTDFITKSFSDLPLELVEQNYTPDVVEGAKKCLGSLGATSHGLILVGGPVGTGKSYLIRALLTEMRRKRRAVVCSPASDFMNHIGRLTNVLSHFRKSIIILEDIGEVLSVDAPTRVSEQRSQLLNLSEGLLSLLGDCILLLSFNHDVGKLDPAVTRPGRCIAKIEVGKLSYEQAQRLVGFPLVKKAYSLAEVYEMRSTGKLAESGTLSLGFGKKSG